MKEAGSPGPDSGKLKKKMKIPFVRRLYSPKTSSKPTTCIVVEDTLPKAQEVVLDFMENLRQNRLAEATQQLISQEEQLFRQGTVGEETEENKLQEDWEILLSRMWMAVHATFSSTSAGEHLETLRSAAASITQQEEQDRRWEGQPEGVRVPDWRPHRCRSTHDALLQKMVESRLRNALKDEAICGEDKLSTDMKKEVCKVGKRLKEDLLVVVKDVRDCYPQEFDIFNLYASIYHRTFSTRLTELARSGVDVDDCLYLLFWINDYYPNAILKNDTLEGNIKNSSLGALLPEADLTMLEKQYLAHKEAKVKTWFSSILRREEDEVWSKGKRPELIDGYCFSSLAIDVLEVVDSAMKEARSVLSKESQAQKILHQLDSFLTSYKSSLDELVKRRLENTQAILKANLVSIQQFRDFISTSEGTMDKCTSTLTSLRDCGYGYFTSPMHGELKVHYRKLWTQPWLKGSQMILDNILRTLDKNLQQFKDLKPVCMEELVGRLHTDVMVEYVKRMMKRKIKLRDREQQVTAARLLCEDSRTLDTFFTEWGSKESWLSEVLLKLAEVVRLQDPGIIQLEIVTLARDYPDLSCRHVSALLSCKATLTAAVTRDIKESLEVNRPSVTQTNNTPPFFSKIPVK